MRALVSGSLALLFSISFENEGKTARKLLAQKTKTTKNVVLHEHCGLQHLIPFHSSISVIHAIPNSTSLIHRKTTAASLSSRKWVERYILITSSLRNAHPIYSYIGQIIATVTSRKQTRAFILFLFAARNLLAHVINIWILIWMVNLNAITFICQSNAICNAKPLRTISSKIP